MILRVTGKKALKKNMNYVFVIKDKLEISFMTKMITIKNKKENFLRKKRLNL